MDLDLGTGSEIYLINYKVNGKSGHTVLCPNAVDFFWDALKKKHKLKEIKSFWYEKVKVVGISNYY